MIKRVYIEILNTCNLNCSFCDKNSRIPRQMSVQEFSHVLDEIEPLTRYIYLHVQGEPLMHPQLEELLLVCDRRDFHVQLVTNATFLDRWPNLCLHPSLRKISFSLQSIEYQPQPDPTEYMNRILSFCRSASEAGHPYCEIRFWRDDQSDLPKTRQCLDMICAQYEMKPTGRPDNYAIMPNIYVDFDNAFSWPEQSNDNSLNGTCLGGISQLAVLADGTVVPCCLDAHGSIVLGNLFHQPLSEILQSKRYQNLVTGFRQHRLSEALCRRCSFRRRFDQ